ncbi:MAG TPA: acylphosphatase [Deltaproteobacteria bacterium]|nr:MAG: acylphosphatase [Deltaproteobacteria bacterium GWA2_55_82]OGQ62418.1 MAG: acylphosphatase [Deltaproteobacteria bacterium RIFCSPLOWO2_02_FULL_55_12]OIJ73332.1 MAG: acylphosphatase [Deltaproteobacteria bacterium GWC2_55_46]HBG45394.1 acylphosphatase [Deltaproteobacteria bacterium]HCY10225.1 acylphosphatase [Deltaproteobacteria bacterium]
MDGPVRAHLIIEGLVQGVSYRAATVETARQHGVSGWVKNNPDGNVEAIIEGDKAMVEKLIDWCRKGPPLARVERVNVSWEPFKNEFDDFTALTRYSIY